MLPLSKVVSIDNASERVFGNAKPLPLIQNLPPKGMIIDRKNNFINKEKNNSD